MVVGISVNPDVFITRNVIIDLDASSLLFNSCNDFIAFNPIGVAALPTPNIFTIMLLDIYPIALWLFGISLNNGFIIFDVIFDNLSISPDFSAILIIPSQNAIIPIRENAILTDNSAPVSIEFTTSDNLPFIAPAIKDITIKK